jgi:hypothetical protein
MPNRLIQLFDLDAFIISIIGISNLLNVDVSEVTSFFFDPVTMIGLIDDFFKFSISGFSALILYKKYKKLK